MPGLTSWALRELGLDVLPDLPRLAQDVSAYHAGPHAVPVGSLDLGERDQSLAGVGHEHVHPPPAPAGFRDSLFDLDLTLGILEPVGLDAPMKISAAAQDSGSCLAILGFLNVMLSGTVRITACLLWS